jgi:autotransporter-associated beta strand protein
MKTLRNLFLPRSAVRLPCLVSCNLARKKCALFVKNLAAAMAVFVLAPPSVFAASQTWSNTGTVSANWSETSNWGGATAPGATSGSASTDVATFNTAAGTYGTSGNPILIDSGRNISGLTFNGSAGNYTIGTTSGNALHMTSGGSILLGNGLTTNNTTITINAPLLMYGGLTINNQAPNATNKFVIGGTISSATTGAKTLTLQSVSASATNTVEVTGLISDGSGTISVTQPSGGGLWRLSNDANSFTGNITVQGGTFTVTSFRNVGENSAAGAGSAGSVINLGTGGNSVSFTINGSGNTSNRTINMSGATGTVTINANNASGLQKFTSDITHSGLGNKTLAISGTGAGEFAGAITNSSGNSTTVTKSGAGTWSLSGNNTYSGGTTLRIRPELS